MHRLALLRLGKIRRWGMLLMGNQMGDQLGKHQWACFLRIQTQFQLVLDERQCQLVRQTLQVEHQSLKAFLMVERRSCPCQMGRHCLRDELQMGESQRGMHHQMVVHLKGWRQLAFHHRSRTRCQLGLLDELRELALQRMKVGFQKASQMGEHL